MTHITRFSTFSLLAILLVVAPSVRAATLNSAHDVAKTTVKAPVVAAPPAEGDATEAKSDGKANDGKTKPAPKPKPKPKPGPRDDGDGD